MKAMVMTRPGEPLRLTEMDDPRPGPGEARLRVLACGVCRTDLHIVDAELTQPRLPLIPGHEIVGEVDELGPGVISLAVGTRVGVGWLGRACHRCGYCLADRENLCDAPDFTGYTRNGGYASHVVVDADYAYPLGDVGEDAAMAPLLCSGLIGWRSLVVAGPGEPLGLYGFGAAGHIILQVARWQGRRTFAFTRPGDREGQAFARSLGASWAGGSDERPPEPMAAAIIYAPAGELVPQALRNLKKGGRVVCAGIHMSDIPGFPYDILWEERSVTSVANLTRQDAVVFLDLAPRAAVKTRITSYPL